MTRRLVALGLLAALPTCTPIVDRLKMSAMVRYDPLTREEVVELVRANPAYADHALVALVVSDRPDRCDAALLTQLFDAGAKPLRAYSDVEDYPYRDDYARRTAFELAVARCPAATLELFVRRWPEIAAQPQVGHVAVERAAKAEPSQIAERMAVFRLVAERGARFDYVPVATKSSLRSEQPQALHLAAGGCEAHHLELTTTLLAKGSSVNARDGYRRTALHRAAGTGCLSLARLLLEKGADPNLKSYEGETALNAAKDSLEGDVRGAMTEMLETKGAVATSMAEREEMENREAREREIHRDAYKREQAAREEAYLQAEAERRRQENLARIAADQQMRQELAAMNQAHGSATSLPGGPTIPGGVPATSASGPGAQQQGGPALCVPAKNQGQCASECRAQHDPDARVAAECSQYEGKAELLGKATACKDRILRPFWQCQTDCFKSAEEALYSARPECRPKGSTGGSSVSH